MLKCIQINCCRKSPAADEILQSVSDEERDWRAWEGALWTAKNHWWRHRAVCIVSN